ncbi:MAG TPA: MerR family transcriptional regulator [Microbacteriaceae bacterium]|nr:MerR family transcriptional regulator [Microbacteriaceae bacterium]
MARQNAAAASLLGIGQVLAKLSPEFPDLTPSKLRFLEEQGLVSPSRTRAGYRKFSSADVERLRLVLTMQRERYLPLRVIHRYLDDLDAGRAPRLPGAVGAASILDSGQRLTKAALLARTGASAALFSEAVSASLISPAQTYDEGALRILTALVALWRSGIEPRHLRTFRGAWEREVSLIESALLPVSRHPGSSSKERAAELAKDIARNLDVIRSGMVRRGLNDRGF